MKLQIILAIALIILVAPVVSAEIILKEDTAGSLRRPCFDDFAFCDNTFTCNITISQSDGTIIIENQAMTRQETYYNITLTAANLNNSGIYNSFMVCTDGTNNGEDTFTFTVNPTGIQASDQRTNTMGRTIWIITIISILLFVSAFFITFPPIKWTAILFGMMFLLMTINLLLVTLQDEVVNPNIVNLFDTFVALSWYLYWVVGGLIFFVWFITFIINVVNWKETKQKRLIEGIE